MGVIDIGAFVCPRKGDDDVIFKMRSFLTHFSGEDLSNIGLLHFRRVTTDRGTSEDDINDIHVRFLRFIPCQSWLDPLLCRSSLRLFCLAPDELAKVAMLDKLFDYIFLNVYNCQ